MTFYEKYALSVWPSPWGRSRPISKRDFSEIYARLWTQAVSCSAFIPALHITA